jgi:DNA (cytosine-5)-methyltransferase 1
MEDKDDMKRWSQFHQFDFTLYNGEQRRQKIARNLVDYEAGKTIFDVARGIIEKTKTNQINLEL